MNGKNNTKVCERFAAPQQPEKAPWPTPLPFRPLSYIPDTDYEKRRPGSTDLLKAKSRFV